MATSLGSQHGISQEVASGWVTHWFYFRHVFVEGGVFVVHFAIKEKYWHLAFLSKEISCFIFGLQDYLSLKKGLIVEALRAVGK